MREGREPSPEDDTVYTDEEYFQYSLYNEDEQIIGISAYTGPDTVTRINEEVFRSCSNLEEIVLPDSTISIRASAFDGTAWYENQPDGMVYIGRVAYGYKCDNMEGVTAVEIADGTLGIAERAFFNFVNLREISVPDSVLSIGSQAFAGTAWLEAAENNTVVYAGKVAYLYNASYTSNAVAVELPDSVTTIGGAAFFTCHSLSSITIPESVTYIGQSVVVKLFCNTCG